MKKKITMFLTALMAVTLPLMAQSEWENSARVLQTSITGPVSKALGLTALVLAGLELAFDRDGRHHKAVGALVVGLGLSSAGAAMYGWLFP